MMPFFRSFLPVLILLQAFNGHGQDKLPPPRQPIGVLGMGSLQSFPLKTLYQSWGYGKGMYFDGCVRLGKQAWYAGLNYAHSRHNTTSNRIDYMTDDSIPVMADLEIKNLSDIFTLYVRREFILENRPAIVPYVEAGLGYTFFKTSLRVSSEHSETVTQTNGQPQTDFCVPYDPEKDPSAYTTTVNVRDTYELYDVIKDNTWHWYAGAGCHFGVFPFSHTDANGKFYEEPRGVFLHVGVGFMSGGNISYMNIKATSPQEDHAGHTGHHVQSELYSIDFINLQTQAIHSHGIAYIYTSPLNMLLLRIGLSVKF